MVSKSLCALLWIYFCHSSPYLKPSSGHQTLEPNATSKQPPFSIQHGQLKRQVGFPHWSYPCNFQQCRAVVYKSTESLRTQLEYLCAVDRPQTACRRQISVRSLAIFSVGRKVHAELTYGLVNWSSQCSSLDDIARAKLLQRTTQHLEMKRCSNWRARPLLLKTGNKFCTWMSDRECLKLR